MKRKTRKDKEKIYKEKYSDIPKDYNERLEYIIDKYNVSEKQFNDIIYRKRNMEHNLEFLDFRLVLYEIPEGTPRHRYRIINKSNYMNAAIAMPSYVHVYQPNAKEDHVFMKRLVDEELNNLNIFVQTPCNIVINNYFPMPSNYNVSDIIISEYGLNWCIKKPDWDNIGKKYSDMYNSNIWLDDKLVISGQVNKFYSVLPRVEIDIHYLNVVPTLQDYNLITKQKDYNQEHPIQYLDKQGNRKEKLR